MRNKQCSQVEAHEHLRQGQVKVRPVGRSQREERDGQAHTRHFGLYRSALSGAGLAQPDDGGQETRGRIGCDHLG